MFIVKKLMTAAIALVVVVLVGGCVSAGAGASFQNPGASGIADASPPPLNLDAGEAARAQIDLSALPATAPPPAVTPEAALSIAEAHAMGGPVRGPLLGVGRGRAAPDAASPERTVWVIAFGPGGQVPLTGPNGGSEPILLQIVAVDDQTGEFMRSYIKSGT
jgi:hypothetical protein